MKAGDLVFVHKEFKIRPGLVVEKYDIEPYWKVQLLGTTECVLVEPENLEVLNEGG
jgi:hypothetical protein